MYDMKSDFEWFKNNRNEIIKNHIGERVVIQNKEIKGYYSDEEEAMKSMLPVPAGHVLLRRHRDAPLGVLHGTARSAARRGRGGE